MLPPILLPPDYKKVFLASASDLIIVFWDIALSKGVRCNEDALPATSGRI
jgi:hypothetical protein